LVACPSSSAGAHLHLHLHLKWCHWQASVLGHLHLLRPLHLLGQLHRQRCHSHLRSLAVCPSLWAQGQQAAGRWEETVEVHAAHQQQAADQGQRRGLVLHWDQRDQGPMMACLRLQPAVPAC
jgi:hypothetical protein